MDGIDVSKGRKALLHDADVMESLPAEIIEIIRDSTSSCFLETVATFSLQPHLTIRFFTRFENIFADICARWIQKPKQEALAVIESFARILPFAPHLGVYLTKFLSSPSSNTLEIPYLSNNSTEPIANLATADLQRVLLAGFRLLRYDRNAVSKSISSPKIQDLLAHDDRSVRYLAVRIFCILLSASDAKLEEMITSHVGNTSAVIGSYDGTTIDYGFLSLFEQKRRKDVKVLRDRVSLLRGELSTIAVSELSSLVTCHGSVLLPRPQGAPAIPTALVATNTTSQNLENVCQALLSPSPILIHGLSGSGKTSLVNDLARELGKDSTMVTLHLNEQTDAKMLIGMYTTDTKPGSFTWRAGVLTTAIREGRWVFIEDLDRAPNEVISVILPLVERGELLIPSRSETVKAASGFRLIASIRTSLNMSGVENPPAMHMLGSRLWNRVPVKMATQVEFQQIINGTYPILQKFLPGIIAVYDRLHALSQKSAFASKSRTSLGRPISPRDLLKWCRRLDSILVTAGSKKAEDPITEATKDEMFMEAADVFASSLQTEELRRDIILAIAEEMQIPPQRAEHYIEAHIPRYEDKETTLQIGRVKLAKKISANRVMKIAKKPRPFANTSHAKRLLEQVGVALKMAEPVLLVGETGIGKTTVIQQLADSLGYKLTAVNLSQQSEVGDLLGGFKPVNVRSLAIPLKEEFDDLFATTGLSATRNQKYLESLGKCVAKAQWSKASKLWREAPKMFDRIISDLVKMEATKADAGSEQPTKRRKTESRLQTLLALRPRWARFAQNLEQFDVQLSGGSKGFAFSFVEGNIIKAVRNGDWVLLDEINLASPDTLEAIADLLQSGPGSNPSILLSETGEIERIRAHPDFRIFGAMNPATDVGKRDLPMGLRSRFTELYVESPDRNLDDLLAVIEAYLKTSSSNDKRAAHDVARLYLNTKRLADEKRLVDGASQVPHFSLRTLTRVLSYVTEIAPSYGLRRALYEGYAMGFLTLLDRNSEQMLMPLINHHLLDSHGNPQALLAQTPKHPEDGKQYVRFMNKKKDRQYWMLQGKEIPQEQPHYIITPFVERNMLNLVRATSTRRFPVLVQGPTSAGKTSMIEYLAKFSGNKFVRINNHEHTDLQEYLGTYVSGVDGQLRFQEGLLVQALREGHWIVLDELNLAPTDVLEALNRLLDDNRELLIPETQEIVRPHENFMLFATQNPPGLYGGRKTLSRAFRNRFLELHFDDIPEDELEFILQHRSQKVAPSDCKRIVTVYKELSRLRQSSRLFEQKDSFATLRDLFRWALRDADNREQLAANGYMLLAERVRKSEERDAVKEIIEKVMKVKIDAAALYGVNASPEINLYDSTSNIQGVVWTSAMRRLYVLVAHALRNNEPVLLVGETGCGKTTVCQMLADAFGKDLNMVNAHQNTETGDLIGAQRPVRNRAVILEQLENDLVEALGLQQNGASNTSPENFEALLTSYKTLSPEQRSAVPAALHDRIAHGQAKSKALFEWSDGSLVQAMKEAQFFLLDEISLADDSVLERLNSVLEPSRTILLAEKGITDSFVKAADGFQFFATMNPGGDYGKRELSPALRNRFTEIWVPSLSERDDIFQIVKTKLSPGNKDFAKAMVGFAEWFGQTFRSSSSQIVSVRDVLAWVSFQNRSVLDDKALAFLHGACLVYIDTLGANPAALLAIGPESIQGERQKCLEYLNALVDMDMKSQYSKEVNLSSSDETLTFGDFSIARLPGAAADANFAFSAPTTKSNAMRVVRALQLTKPILLEGSPGVGKTTLIGAIAQAVGKSLTRINLSEQTDLMDLFGSDVPVEGAEAGNFAWRDAAFLQAMQRGDWVLLDEMNLASQSVLEGLNACLDHRGEVYISELDQTFKRHPNFAVFAAQNPHHQGGGRKGLPSSFVNRFTVVYADVFRNDDLKLICKHNFPSMDEMIMSNVISFVSQLEQDIIYRRRFGSQGGPWEFNLRDTLRWLHLLSSTESLLAAGGPADFLNLIFRQRFRSVRDRQEVDRIFSEIFSYPVPFRHLFHNLSSDAYQVGMAYLPRHKLVQKLPLADVSRRLAELESVMMCVQQNVPCILVGSSGSGKTVLLQHTAAVAGVDVVTFPLNSDIDTMDLVGGFEQVDPQRTSSSLLKSILDFLELRVLGSLPGPIPQEALDLLSLCQNPEHQSNYYISVRESLVILQQKTSILGLDVLIESCETFLNGPRSIQSARFEWVDGILVKALEEGKWLILDNANLCSSSVLDRLNSLLEPNGVLSINEHCGPDGEPKLVKPHPDFRLFITMDPRYGELSRAMRNRAAEIYLEHPSSSDSSDFQLEIVESQLQRFEYVVGAVEDHDINVAKIALQNLSGANMALLPRFAEVLPVLATCAENTSNVQNAIEQLQEAIGSGLGENIGKIYSVLVSSAKLSDSFADAQTIHPLQNSPLVPLLQLLSGTDQSYWLGACLEVRLDMIQARKLAEEQQSTVDTLKPSQMNRLQRSMVASRVPAVAKDSTAKIASFLQEVLISLDAYLRANTSPGDGSKVYRKVLQTILRFWRDTFDLATGKAFEEATFQAHLAIGAEEFSGNFLGSYENDGSTAQTSTISMMELVKSKLGSNFDAGFKLTTGLSMEQLWLQLRPLPVPDLNTLHTILELEQIAARFDSIRWKVSISVSELADILASLISSFKIVLTSMTNASDLVNALNSELSSLESRLLPDTVDVVPFFASQFEALRQYKAIEMATGTATSLTVSNKKTEVLAYFSTKSLLKLASASKDNHVLPAIEYLWHTDKGLKPTEDSFGVELLHQMRHIDDVDLNSLRLLETELPILGRDVAAMSGSVCKDQISGANGINFVLVRLIDEVLGSLDKDLAARARVTHAALSKTTTNGNISLVPSETLQPLPAHLETIYNLYIEPCISAMAAAEGDSEDKLKNTSIAWVNFSVACIALYIPDRSFDPDKRQRLERLRHEELSNNLKSQLAALKQFESKFTNQDSSLRIQVLERDLVELGEPADILQQIYRPEDSELDQLQGEFNNLLNLVHTSKPCELVSGSTSASEAIQSLKFLQNNILQVIRRLSERFRAYGDMTVPAIGMLRCLQIGISMALMSSVHETPDDIAIRTLSSMTPFMGGGPSTTIDSTEHPLEQLAHTSTVASVEGLGSFQAGRRRQLFNIVHTCFEDWTKRLEADRKDAESKTGLYRYRGSAEDEEEMDQEQFNDLFPAYDDSESESEVKDFDKHTTRDTAVALADVHAQIVLEKRDPSDSLKSLLRDISRRIGTSKQGKYVFVGESMTRNLLPGAILSISDNLEALQSSDINASSYNFYTSANLPESRKLVQLIHQIQVRYRQLQDVDEIAHMQPLEDVLVSCRELLQFRYTEPLAKIITKVEKVHTYMHEWQFGGWASRANSAVELYNGLTQTIVNWRRLELSTWAKLFEMENKQCEEDAKSWWFVAYQVVVAAPLGISESESELREYAQKLLLDLEVYFSSAIQGQFIQRLKLLKQLQKHLELLAEEMPLLSIISTAVLNFLDIYVRYERPVVENLKRGKAVLEKTMKDVLLLASWKDTNIVALRDSAKRSHHKLFKLVRKYRTLLGQPMDLVLKQGLPDESETDLDDATHKSVSQPLVNRAALAFCESNIPGWTKKSKRFVNVSQTVSMMDDATRFANDAVDGASYLESFIANIAESVAELQKATPAILTEENKVTVKHLKSRKRKLFADTIKELRLMGVKHNLGTVALAKQESLSLVLSCTGTIAGEFQNDVEYYYHKAVELIPRARAAVREHSEDLSNAEMIRSTGLIEGLLQVVIKQRNTLSTSTRDAKNVESVIREMGALWSSEFHLRSQALQTNHQTVLQWIPNLLRVATDLVNVYSKLGKTQVDEIVDMLSGWKDKFESLRAEWRILPTLPLSLASTKHESVIKDVESAVVQLRLQLIEVATSSPDLEFILGQIVPWASITSEHVGKVAQHGDVTTLDEKLSKTCDVVLVAIEKYKKSAQSLPASTEEGSWFMLEEQCLASNIASLHSEEVTSHISQSFSLLATLELEDNEISKSASAVFAVALPIFEQYFNILNSSINRYKNLHKSTCKTTYILTKIFIQIATQGFCTPGEKSNTQDGKTDKLEGGTGLGEGEGAEDISKDIQDDENLDELAQEPNKEEQGDIEDEQDAVDMADGDMEGDMGEAGEKEEDEEGSDKESEGEDMDEEAGDVDDLDPNAVDEKMWDGDGEEAEKDQEGDESKGKASKDEQVAAQENDKQGADGDEGDEEEDEEEEAGGAEQSEEVQQQDDVEKHDPKAQEGETLELPEEMELDGDGNEVDESVGSEDGMDDLSDIEDAKDEMDESKDADKEGEDAEGQEDQEMGDDLDVIDLDNEEDADKPSEDTEEAGEKADGDDEKEGEDEEEKEGLLKDQVDDDAKADPDNAIPSEAQGTGEDQNENENKDDSANTKAQREEGGKGGDSAQERDEAAEDGDKGRQASGDSGQDQNEDTQTSSDAQPFKKLGDALEKWHRQQTKIQETKEQSKSEEQPLEVNGDNSEFQHLQDEEAEADAQALGTATEEQSHALDESMAIDSESKEMPETFQPDDVEAEGEGENDDVMDLADDEPAEQEQSDAYEGRAGAMIKQSNQERDSEMDENRMQEVNTLEEDVEEVDTQLSATHIENPTALTLSRSADDARSLWTHYEGVTRDLSLSLTEQLRLILAPTQATKMRGDFRTGKRLNIKRIIPYIASQYKRDKIWMRRSVPSKRSYQIMLAVDDSKSMGESGSGTLAFETLAMVSKSLSMLEVGEICVVGFGQDVRVAHEFDSPFSADAGPKVFQNFGFEQSRTDVTKLVRESIELFRAARAKASNAPTDLWQLELIISDGVCDSSEHEPIRRLLREAIEERIMMVFVVVDDLKNKKKGESVMDLKEAKFVKNEMTGGSEVKIERYLDTFPFQYYLIVSDVRELPGVLATLLRQWFAEVADSS